MKLVRRGRLLAVLLCVHASAVLAVDLTVARPAEMRVDRYADVALIRVLPAGTKAELLKSEAGWVQVRVDGTTGWLRASGLVGDAASVSSLARLETGRGATGNIVVAAGIRGLPKASKHALIVGVDAVVGLGPKGDGAWPGVTDDVAAARLIASRLGVPDANVDVVAGADATLDGIDRGFARLNERVQPGDEVLVYWSGPGTQALDASRCAPAWIARDGLPLTAEAIAKLARPATSAAGKILFVADAGYATSRTARIKAIALPTPRACAAPSGRVVLDLVDVATRYGASAQNVVELQPTPGPSQGGDTASGGPFTQALTDCVLGDAVDVDRSGSISIGELAACIDRRGQPSTVTGNAAYGPLVGVVSPPSTAPTSSDGPRAAIDAAYAQRDGRIGVTLTATPTTLAIGRDALDLTLSSTHAGHVYLVLLGSDGTSFYLLFPNDLDHDHRIAAGGTLRLPRPQWRVQAQGPAGKDTILAIVAESERDLAMLGGRKEGPFAVALTDVDGRARLQSLLGRSGQAKTRDCVEGGQRRNLAAVAVCSDAYGAAIVEVIEK